ncbi:MAG: two-component sensor histidine kinase [Oscillochloris sp.]|nr:two-component sensor histidine kinase [Oscillochloris sp.]
MNKLDSSVPTLIKRLAPYPPAVQGVATLVLLATPLSALGMFAATPAAFWQFTAFIGLHVVLLSLVPVRRLPLWAQLTYLVVQCALTTCAGTILPAPLLDYNFLVIVLQAIALFRPWLWISFAVLVLALWNGLVLIATANFWAWLQSNLALAFPATCVIIAAIVYTRQLRRNEQVQQALRQMQQHYDSLAGFLRDQQQHVILEERRRLSQTIADEMQSALARAEQSVALAINQTQSNLARLQTTVSQTRTSATAAIERLRSSISALRRGEIAEYEHPFSPVITLSAGDELIIGARPSRVLTWVLPIVFVLLSIGLTLLQHRFSVDVLSPVLIFGSLLLITSVFTQTVRHPLLLGAGLIAQAFAVLMMALLTHTLPLLLGLLLVLWQAAVRLSPGQALMFLLGAPTSLGVLLAQLRPTLLDYAGMVPYAVAAVAVTAPLLLARRQHTRRRQAELQLALLTAEIEQQTAEVHKLAVTAERTRLAREFHDDLGSRLMLINLQLQLAEDLAEEDADGALAQLQSSRELLQAAWRSVIAVADADLPLADGNLLAALHDLIEQARRLNGAEICLLQAGLEQLPAEVASAIYRTVQEGLSNAHKHARPRRIDVRVIAEGEYVTATIDNDDSASVEPLMLAGATGSFGLIGLRERVEMLGGGIEAGPFSARGWRLRLVLPVEPRES